MAKVIDVSDFLNSKRLPDSTGAYRMENGETFFFDWTQPQFRLYVRSSGREIYAKLPQRQISEVGAFKNALYFEAARKLYKATYNEREKSFTVEYLRDQKEGESLYDGAFCSQVRNGETYVYRMCDDPETGAIRIDVRDLGADLCDIHNGKVIYITYSGEDTFPSVNKISDTVYVIKTHQWSNHTFLRDESYIYFTHGQSHIITLDTETMVFLPILRFKDLDILNIVCVHRGFITVRGSNMGLFLKTAYIPEAFTEVVQKHNEQKKNDEKEFKNNIKRQEEEIKVANVMLTTAVGMSNFVKAKMDGVNDPELIAENEKMKVQIKELQKKLIECNAGALQTVKKTLKFADSEKLTKPLVCIQLGDGIMLFFDNAKPFELFYLKDRVPINANLNLLNGEYDCSFRGTIGHHAYFNTIRGKVVKFFCVHVKDGDIFIDKINEMRTSEISLFKNQPLYYIERSKEWSVYKYGENYTEVEGEKFDISEIDLLSKYERHYHRGILYLFRETSTANIERVNEKVVKVEGPLLDETISHFYTPSHSDCIYILNSDENVILMLNTTDLTVSQMCYEAPADSNNHSIVGIHNGTLTMAFDGVWGRHLSTTKMSQ